jgi:hypothetical protein
VSGKVRTDGVAGKNRLVAHMTEHPTFYGNFGQTWRCPVKAYPERNLDAAFNVRCSFVGNDIDGDNRRESFRRGM